MFNDQASNVPNAVPFRDSGCEITFTPTTLATLENTLSNLNEDIAASFDRADVHQYEVESRRLWSDSADYTGDDDDGDDSEDSSNSEWTRVKNEIPSSVPSMNEGHSESDQRPARKLPGPRPARSIDNVNTFILCLRLKSTHQRVLLTVFYNIIFLMC